MQADSRPTFDLLSTK